MPFITANGLLVLLPAAIFVDTRACAGTFDMAFYVVQVIDLCAVALNLTMMGLNIPDGRAMARRPTGAEQAIHLSPRLSIAARIAPRTQTLYIGN